MLPKTSTAYPKSCRIYDFLIAYIEGTHHKTAFKGY
jgi:hypothetical protein